MILQIILHKLYQDHFPLNKPISFNLLLKETLVFLANNTSRKRHEEKYKLCFKRGLKHAMMLFKASIDSKNMSKAALEKLFIAEFFSQENLNMPECGIFNPKTVNSAYIRLLVNSKRLSPIIFNYVSTILVDQYLGVELEKKILRIVSTCKSMYSRNPRRAKERLEKHILNNSKFKLPWAKVDLTEAKSVVLAVFNK